MQRILLLTAAAMLSAMSCSRPAPVQDATVQPVRLPNGEAIQCEVLLRPEDMARGMMFRDSLAAGRGMLFLHSQPGRYPYWMYQVKVPLDIIWMSRERKIVEMSLNTPPCQGKPASQCPNNDGQPNREIVGKVLSGLC